MKTKMLFIALFAMTSFCVNAQTESSDYSNYLNDAMKKLEAGDCKGARAYYNIYKELSGKSVSSVETMLNGCKSESTYAVYDKIIKGDTIYTVYYVEDNGKHGLALCEMAKMPLSGELGRYLLKRRMIPTCNEFDKMSSNLPRGVYWTADSYDESRNFIIETSSGGNSGNNSVRITCNSYTCGHISDSYTIAIIYRF